MKVFLTGATGVMGMKGMQAILKRKEEGDDLQLTVLARPGKRNMKKLHPYIEKGVRVIWGDLLDPAAIELGVGEADLVLHVGGMVSPAADWFPEKTYKVNTESMALITEAARRKEARGEKIKVVYIGSVAQYGNRPYPVNWGRTGDPISSVAFDKYALSKSVAEIILAESGLKEWVSLRQTSILHPGLLGKADDPIAFHVPMATGLEWVSDDDSGRLLAALCSENIPDDFWRNFYNVGGGESYRMSNYEFMKSTLAAVGSPPPEKVFELNWFATGNFHGMFYDDSDKLDKYLHFRSGETFSAYMERLKKGLPFYFKMAPLAPAFVIKMVMKQVANKKLLGTQCWIKEGNRQMIEAAYGGMEGYNSIPDWSGFKLPRLKEKVKSLDHGYDESKDLETLTFKELRRAADFRGGQLTDERFASVKKDNEEIGCRMDESMEWICCEGHRFRLTPRTVLKGGHWCPECLAAMNSDPGLAERLSKENRFLAQVTGD